MYKTMVRLLQVCGNCSGLIELDTFVRENEHTNRGAYDREKTCIQTIPRRV